MKITDLQVLIIVIITTICPGLNAQVNSLEFNEYKEKMFTPYMLWRHGGNEGLAEFKKDHPHDYLKELWYYSESFYVKKDHFTEGNVLVAEGIDITRFESSRKETDESIVILPGYKDVLILLPKNKLIFMPENK